MACPRFIEINDSGKPKTAYFTDDLADAIEHGRTMAAARATDQAATTPESTQRAPQRKSHRKMTPEAQRRRLIRLAQPAARSASDQEAARGRLGQSPNRFRLARPRAGTGDFPDWRVMRL